MKEADLIPKAVELCMAIRAGKEELALDLLDKLLVLQSKPEVAVKLLRAVKNALSAAARLRDKSLFLKLLGRAHSALLQLGAQPELQGEFLELLNTLLFEVCDKKIVGSGELVQQLCKSFCVQANRGLKEAWCVETLNLAARILRRGWLEVGQWLLRRVLKQLYKEKDLPLLQRILPRIELHLVLSCRYDGLEKTVEAYRPVQGFYLWLLEQAERSESLTGQAYLVLALRSLREWVSNSATTLMQEELEVYETWHKAMLAQLGPLPQQEQALSLVQHKALQRRRQLIQLALLYWNRTKPKSSRKQFRYLQELLEPKAISPKLEAWLDEVV